MVASLNIAAPVIKSTISDKFVALYTAKRPKRENLTRILEQMSMLHGI